MRQWTIVRWLSVGGLVMSMAACIGNDETGGEPPPNRGSATATAAQLSVASPTLEASVAALATTTHPTVTAAPTRAGTVGSTATATVTRTVTTATTETLTATSQSTATTAPSPTPTTEEPTATPEPTEIPEPTPDLPSMEDPTEEPVDDDDEPVIVLTGSGAWTSEAIWLDPGLLVVRVLHDGAETVSLGVLSEVTGEEIDGFFVPDHVLNAGSASYIQEAGNYIFDVVTEGEWTINVVQLAPEQSQVEPLPWSWSGSGPQVFYVVELPAGLHTVTATHDGSEFFVVEVLRVTDMPDAMFQQIVLEEFETSNSAASFEVPEGGLFAVVVESEGTWSLTIE